jgi:hypothetical protein
MIKRVLTYIEMMPITRMSLFWKKIDKFGSLLKNDYPTLNDPRLCQELIEKKIFMPNSLSNKERIILGSIHIAIMKAYLKTWTYSYPPNQTGEVTNQVIENWHKECREKESKDHVDYDFNRSITVMAKKCESNSLESSIGDLFNLCSAYKQEDKQKLIQWVRKQGGQEMDRFITLSAIAGDFTNDKEGEGPSIGCCNKIKMDWHQEHDKLCFEIDYFIKTLQYGHDVMLNYDGVVNKFTHLTDELEQRLSGKIPLPPLMRVHAKIELDMIEGAITPKIVAYDVTSYTKFLKSPERKYTNPRVNLQTKKRNDHDLYALTMLQRF